MTLSLRWIGLVAALSLGGCALSSWQPRELPAAERWATQCTEDYRRVHDIALKDLTKIQWKQATTEDMPRGAIAFTDTGTNIIFVRQEWQDSVWVLSHELVHWILNVGDHPFDPFAFPCRVLPLQHTPGGLMGQGLHVE